MASTIYVTGPSKYVEFATGHLLVNGQVLYIDTPFRVNNTELVGSGSGSDVGDYYIHLRFNRKPMESYYIKNYEVVIRATTSGGTKPTEMPDEFAIARIEKRLDVNGDITLAAIAINRGKKLIDTRHISDGAITSGHLSQGLNNWTMVGTLNITGNISTSANVVNSGNIVTSVPGSPTNGQEILWRPAVSQDLYWQMKYIGSISKWVWTGGSPILSVDGAARTTSSNTYQTTGSPALTVPATGVYEVAWGAKFIKTNATISGSNEMQLGVFKDGTQMDVLTVAVDVADGGGSAEYRAYFSLTNAQVVDVRYRSNSSVSSTFTNMWVTLKPATI